MELKTCSHCGEAKPATREYFHFSTSKPGAQKLHAKCISCVLAYAKKRAALRSVLRNTEEAKQHWCPLQIACTCCGLDTPHWFIAKGKRCQACEAVRRNPERDRPAFDQYRESLMLVAESKHLRRYCGKNRCQSCGVIHAFDAARPKRWQHVCLDCERATIRAYRGTRRERFSSATPPWADMDQIAAIYAGRPDGFHVDHIVPLDGRTPDGRMVCGLHVAWNLRYLPGAENISRGNRMTEPEVAFVETCKPFPSTATQMRPIE